MKKAIDIIARVDQLIKQGEDVLLTRHDSGYGEYVSSAAMNGLRSAVLSFIMRIYSSDHPYYSEFDNVRSDYHPSNIESSIAILKSIKNELEGGWIFTLKGLVSAEIFADFLEMAEHLLSNDYKDAAAVITGSVLEEHLRQLCIKNGIEIEIEQNGDLKPKKADRLNSDLANAEIYNKLDQKSVTTWLDLRNKAAHGKYSDYNKDQVALMLQGITEFMSRVTV